MFLRLLCHSVGDYILQVFFNVLCRSFRVMYIFQVFSILLKLFVVLRTAVSQFWGHVHCTHVSLM